MVKQLVIWLFFRLLLALVPIAAEGMRLLTNGVVNPFGSAIERGELLLISTALCGGSMGILISALLGATAPTPEPLQIERAVALGAAFIVFAVSSLHYTNIAASYRAAPAAVNVSSVKKSSFYLFLAGVVSSAACVALGV